MNVIDIIYITIGLLILVFITLGCIYVRHMEKKDWNKGYCRTCGKPWIHYATDSHGGRMYRCDNWHSCDVSYNVDKR